MPIPHPALECPPERRDLVAMTPPPASSRRRQPRQRAAAAAMLASAFAAVPAVGVPARADAPANLLDSRRKETVPELLPLTATQVERAAYGKLTLRF